MAFKKERILPMKKTKKGMRVLICSVLVILAGTHTAMADRQTSIKAGLFVRQGFDSNVNRTPEDEIDEWTTAVGPSISIDSKGSRDSFLLRYAPSYVFNYRSDDGEFDHHLFLAADRALSDKLRISMTDAFERSDDSTLARYTARYTEETSADTIQLSENLQRVRYWLNSFNIRSAWEYRQNSSFGLKYNHAIYDTNGQQSDYQRHAPSVTISHEINHQWLADAGYEFIHGEFDQEDNSNQHKGNARLTYRLSPHSSLYGEGNYVNTDYDGERIGYWAAGGRLGLSRQIDPRTAADVAAGYATVDREGDDTSEAFSYALLLTRDFEKGAVSFSGSGGYDDQKLFNGEADGLSQFWSLTAEISYDLAQNITSSLHGLYRDDKFIERIPEREEKAYEAGCGLSWSFARWYTAAVRYLFRKVDANIATFDYDDHRLYLTLSVANELWRW